VCQIPFERPGGLDTRAVPRYGPEVKRDEIWAEPPHETEATAGPTGVRHDARNAQQDRAFIMRPASVRPHRPAWPTAPPPSRTDPAPLRRTRTAASRAV